MSENEPKTLYSSESFADVSIQKSSTDRRSAVRLSKRAAEAANALQENGVSPSLISGLVRMSDFVVIALSGLGVFWTRGVMPFPDVSGLYISAFVLAAALGVLAFQMLDCYQIHTFRTTIRQTSRMLAGWVAVFATLATIAFLTKLGDYYSRVWFGTWLLTGIVALGIQCSSGFAS